MFKKNKNFAKKALVNWYAQINEQNWLYRGSKLYFTIVGQGRFAYIFGRSQIKIGRSYWTKSNKLMLTTLYIFLIKQIYHIQLKNTQAVLLSKQLRIIVSFPKMIRQQQLWKNCNKSSDSETIFNTQSKCILKMVKTKKTGRSIGLLQ